MMRFILSKAFWAAMILMNLGLTSCRGQQAALLNGPMLGYNELREVQVWVQSTGDQTVQLKYWPESDSDQVAFSNAVQTSDEEGHTAHLTCSLLEPGTTYQYEILLDGEVCDSGLPQTFTTQELWQWRTDPPPFSFAFGSCVYVNDSLYDRPGEPYGRSMDIFKSIQEKKPDLMLWLGDNAYLREVDWNSLKGYQYRYSHMRAQDELDTLLASCHHYAIWDDHDYGPNDSNGSFIHKDIALKVFKQFWANNGYGFYDKESITGQFHYNDVDFFLLDNRSFRKDHNLKGDKETVLGSKQIDWLIEALKYSTAHFKIVAIGGQFLSDVDKYENYAQYEEERLEILDRINRNDIQGVVFLSGDRHSSELTAMQLENGQWIYDFTSSPLTSKSYPNCDEPNSFRVEGTCYTEQNFGIIEVKGEWDKRELHLHLFDATGREVWSRIIQHDYSIAE